MDQVNIRGTKFYIGDVPVNRGTRAEGKLMNFRAVQAAIQEYDASKRDRWRYPDGPWDPDRNTREFIGTFSLYKVRGLDMVTIGMQGGHPRFKCSDKPGGWNFSLFDSAGSLRPDAKVRLERVLTAAAAHGLIVNVQYFYQNQDQRLANSNAVVRATAEATRFLRDLHLPNIIVEVANEVSDRNYKHTAMKVAAIDDRIRQIKSLWPEALVSVSMAGGKMPPSAAIKVMDWFSFHGNSLSPDQVNTKAKKFTSLGKPAVVTEDYWDGGKSLNAALNGGAGWGFYEQGCEFTGTYKPGSPSRYRDGFQSPPINWGISNRTKAEFFDLVSIVTEADGSGDAYSDGY